MRTWSVLIARITRTSAELLALKPGMAVLAMCKATAVKVFEEANSSELSVANQFQGTVTRVSKGDREDEITIELLPGLATGRIRTFRKEDRNGRSDQCIR